MSGNFFGNFKLIAVLVSIAIFMMVMYGYNRAEKKKIPTNPAQLTERQQQAMQAYKRPNIGGSSGCGCGKK